MERMRHFIFILMVTSWYFHARQAENKPEWRFLSKHRRGGTDEAEYYNRKDDEGDNDSDDGD